MKVIFAALVALFSVASALELTPAHFEAEVKGDKNAFVKFQAPWCDPHAPSPQNRQPIGAKDDDHVTVIFRHGTPMTPRLTALVDKGRGRG